MFNSIVNDQVQDWSSLDDTTIDFLSKLLDKNPETWFGANGVEEIQTHDWFKHIDFDLILSLEVKAPFVPDQQTDYIDDEFLMKDIQTAIQPSPQNSDDEAFEEDILKNFDFERN